MTQNTLLIRHLNRVGSISQREALIDYSIQCLTKRIQELREYGFKITSVKRKHPTTGQRYVRYVLENNK